MRIDAIKINMQINRLEFQREKKSKFDSLLIYEQKTGE